MSKMNKPIGPGPSMMSLIYICLICIVFFVFVFGGDKKETMELSPPLLSPSKVSYSDFLHMVSIGKIAEVHIKGDEIYAKKRTSGKMINTIKPSADPGLIGDLLYNGVNITNYPEQTPSMFWGWVPTLLLIAVFIWMSRRAMAAGGGQAGAKGGMTDKALEDNISMDTGVKFSDVAGVDDAKADVIELVHFLKNPMKYQKIGGKMPSGALLMGPSGTGKTLLAKAVAGESGVPFIHMAGSDFVEMYVGVGASRVRKLFEQARKHAPCIIFIDEIDAIGKARNSNGFGGSNDERDQTLNSLLVEMDGFKGSEGIIVLAATNRPEILDAALKRPGRFDRQISVGLPDIVGRTHILSVHAGKVKHSAEVDWEVVARGCVGFSGADLANLINESALTASRRDGEHIIVDDIEHAKDKIMMGAERKTLMMTDGEKEMTAYHEAGHAIIGSLMPEHDPVYKVSIVPRTMSLGVTMYIPERDTVSLSRTKLIGQITSLVGGRAAEEIIYGKDKITTGASNDIERATSLATDMVKKWGFVEDIGLVMYDKVNRAGLDQQHSDNTLYNIDIQVKKLVDDAYSNAKTILNDNIGILHDMTALLIKDETITHTQVNALVNVSSPENEEKHEEHTLSTGC